MSDHPSPSILPYGIARGTLFVFLIAILVALFITVASAPPAVKLLALAAVLPIVALALVLLTFEHRLRPWSFAAAAALGACGVTLRLVINSQPSLEVGGGLPFGVTAAYVALGSAVVATSLWSFAHLRASAPRALT